LSQVFRAKFLEALEDLLDTGQLQLPVALPQLATDRGRRQWLRRLKKKPWIVYYKAPFAGPQKLLDYLGRYTHRVAISNHRLLSLDAGEVQFHWRDRADGDRRKVATLPAAQFIRRFLYHVLPQGFMRIRHYGFLANRIKQQALARCRQQLDAEPPPEEPETKTVADWMFELTGIDIRRCPRCGTQLNRIEWSAHSHLPPALTSVSFFDTS
jgi:hypothetical protein